MAPSHPFAVSETTGALVRWGVLTDKRRDMRQCMLDASPTLRDVIFSLFALIRRVPLPTTTVTDSLHSSQRFHKTAIAQADSADARVVQVDRHPQSNCKNQPVNRVEQGKSPTRTTVAEAQ
jgi:hypothetical protein